jgi:dTDP-4-dehydrorhamnose 3,5-epimerase
VSFEPLKNQELKIEKTNIPGLLVLHLPVHGDNRGWFKENYQKQKMEALGLPSFDVVQNNFSYNKERGVTRGLHAEPWEKFISVANGAVFGAWVDLRKGASFGQSLGIEINPSIAIFVPRGVANGYQPSSLTLPILIWSTSTGLKIASTPSSIFLIKKPA